MCSRRPWWRASARLAAVAPTLADAVRAASTKAHLLLDGTLLPNRIAADGPYCVGKHKECG
jgi:hypothetical protein